MNTTNDTAQAEKPFDTTVAQILSAEDVRPGDYLAIISETWQVPGYVWDSSSLLAGDKMILLEHKPTDGKGPWKVLDVCLPFIFCCDRDQSDLMIDVRLMRFARVSKRFAKTVWKFRKAKSAADKNGGRKKKKRKKSSR